VLKEFWGVHGNKCPWGTLVEKRGNVWEGSFPGGPWGKGRGVCQWGGYSKGGASSGKRSGILWERGDQRKKIYGRGILEGRTSISALLINLDKKKGLPPVT